MNSTIIRFPSKSAGGQPDLSACGNAQADKQDKLRNCVHPGCSDPGEYETDGGGALCAKHWNALYPKGTPLSEEHPA